MNVRDEQDTTAPATIDVSATDQVVRLGITVRDAGSGVNTIEYAIEAPRHVNLGLIEIMPTFQVPGGLTFDRRERNSTSPAGTPAG